MIVSICLQYHFLPYTVTEMNIVDCVALLSISQYLIIGFIFISDADISDGECLQIHFVYRRAYIYSSRGDFAARLVVPKT
jgi:hypothetical protein